MIFSAKYVNAITYKTIIMIPCKSQEGCGRVDIGHEFIQFNQMKKKNIINVYLPKWDFREE